MCYELTDMEDCVPSFKIMSPVYIRTDNAKKNSVAVAFIRKTDGGSDHSAS